MSRRDRITLQVGRIYRAVLAVMYLTSTIVRLGRSELREVSHLPPPPPLSCMRCGSTFEIEHISHNPPFRSSAFIAVDVTPILGLGITAGIDIGFKNGAGAFGLRKLE